MVNVREIILNILMEYDRGGARKPSLLKDVLNKYDYLETRDKAFIKRVTDGCLERNIQIDYILDSYSKTPVKKLQPFIRSLMRMSVYQIMFMEQVPDSAACNEAVKLAARHKFSGLKGFVNGVLRNISRNKDKIEYPDEKLNGGIDYLSVMYSMPVWLCEMWISVYGFEKTRQMLEFFLTARPTTIRLTQKLSDPEAKQEFIDNLKKEGVEVKDNDLLPYALELSKTDNIAFLPGFMEGSFAIMDVSSMLVAEAAGVSKGQTVIDVCSAPGGKALHAAERVGESGKVYSFDLTENKCRLIQENAERLGLNNIEIKVHDARVCQEDLRDKADVLYLDVPCSGLGIIGRKNDIKANVSPKSLEEVGKLQWEIVKASWDYVKCGGTMIYSTCTVNKAENEEMIKKICSELPFEVVDFAGNMPAQLKGNVKDGCLQLVPGEYGTDGFFISRLRRIK